MPSRAPRLACLRAPLFPLAARLRSEPDLLGEAVAVLAGNGTAARVVAATRRARQAGVRPGQTLTQARAMAPRLVARARDEACERAAQEALLEAAGRFSPRLEDAGGGTAYLDIEGMERHFGGGPEAETRLGQALMEAAEAAGLPVRVGIAGSKLAARVAAGTTPSPTVVPAGGEAAFLAPLPLGRLAPDGEVALTLERWGVRCAGELARLPAAEVASRLGPAGEALHAVARGRDPRPLVPRDPPAYLEEGTALEWPLVQLEPFLFVARAALDRLCGRLAALGLGCRRLELSLDLEPDGHDRRSVALPAPTREVKSLLTLVRLDLEARPPGAPVTAFTFLAHPDRPPVAQLSLFGPPALTPGELAATLARLFALLGPERVGSPRPADDHRPERFRLVDYAPPPPPERALEAPPGQGEGRGLLAVRALRPPVELEVLVAGEAPPPGQPPQGSLALREIRSTAAAESGRRPRIGGRVRVAAGPWSLTDGWWSEEPAERDYWDVELADGGLYRVYRDRTSGEWYADGMYD
jgi:protein ImuB